MKKEKITRTKEQETQIIEYIKSKGFKNITEFANAVRMPRQNVWARIKGRTDPDIRMLLRWASVLKCDVDILVSLFYPNEWQTYISK